MAPGSFEAVLLLKQCVCDGQLVLGAKLQEQASVVVAVAKSMFAKNSFPQLGVSAHPSIEIAKDDELVLRVYACDDSVQFTVEGLFYSRVSLQRWTVDTDKSGRLVPLEINTPDKYCARITSIFHLQTGFQI